MKINVDQNDTSPKLKKRGIVKPYKTNPTRPIKPFTNTKQPSIKRPVAVVTPVRWRPGWGQQVQVPAVASAAAQAAAKAVLKPFEDKATAAARAAYRDTSGSPAAKQAAAKDAAMGVLGPALDKAEAAARAAARKVSGEGVAKAAALQAVLRPALTDLKFEK